MSAAKVLPLVRKDEERYAKEIVVTIRREPKPRKIDLRCLTEEELNRLIEGEDIKEVLKRG